MGDDSHRDRRVRLTVDQVFRLMQGDTVVVEADGDRSLTIESDVENARVAGE